MSKIRIYPAPGLTVRHPDTMRPIDPVDGELVDAHDLRFARMLNDGDAVRSPPEADGTAAKRGKPAPPTDTEA